jgi:putative peptidoglycan lipid II flippase
MTHWKRIFNRWCQPIHSVAFSAIVIGLAGIASRLLGLIRDRLLASSFGAGDILDAYYAAFRIPDTIYGLLVAGALSAALVPVFTQTQAAKGEKTAWRLISDLLTILVESLLVLTVIAFVFAPLLLHILVPGFTGEKFELTLQLTRIMLLSPILFGVSAVLGGVLISKKHFFEYSLAPLLYNLGIISGIVMGVPYLGVSALGYGVLIGAFLHLLLQWYSVARSGFAFRPRLSRAWHNRLVRRVILLMIPRSLGMAMSQVSLLLIAFFASTLNSGSLTIFTFAINLQTVPLGLFGISFSLAVFPSLSKLAADQDLTDFFHLLARTARRILFFILPTSVLLIILRAQIVRIILGSGHFNWEDTTLTFQVLGILAISLFAQSLIQLFSRAFFALQNTRTPLLVAFIAEIFQMVLLITLIPHWNIFALALAFAGSSIMNCFLLYGLLRHRLVGVWRDRALFVPVGKILLASLGMGLAAQFTKTWFGLNVSPLDTFVGVFFQAALTSLIALGVFLALSHWMRIEELEHLKNFIRKKVLGQPITLTQE